MDNSEKLERFKWEAEELRKAIGIEHHFRPLQTVYNQASGIIVASVERYSKEAFDRRLFYRRISECVYQQLGSPASDIHYDNLTTSSSTPAIFFTVRRVTPHVKAGEFGGDWLSIDRFDLGTFKAESIITKDRLQLPGPYSRGWVSQLLGVAFDDSAIFCSCGLERPEKGNVHYWLCAVQPRTQSVTLLSRFEGGWF